jgi:hypothetical protein
MSLIAPDTSNYTDTRTAGGKRSQHNGSPVAVALAGMTVDEIKDVAEAMGIEDVDKYDKLNAGQVRMNLGNVIRGQISRIDKANAAQVVKANSEDATKAEKSAATKLKSGADQLEAATKATRKVVDKREAEAEKEREDKVTAAAVAKAEKEAEAKVATKTKKAA